MTLIDEVEQDKSGTPIRLPPLEETKSGKQTLEFKVAALLCYKCNYFMPNLAGHPLEEFKAAHGQAT